MIKSTIVDATGRSISARIDNSRQEANALVVATRPLKEFTSTIKFFVSDEFGLDLNKNPTFGTNPERIHNGNDNPQQWTASSMKGEWDFSSKDQSSIASRSIRSSGSNFDTAVLKSPKIIKLSGYTALAGSIYIEKLPSHENNQIHLQFQLDKTNVKSAVDLTSYIDRHTFDVWQDFTIPLFEFNLRNSDSINELKISNKLISISPIQYYLDELLLEQKGDKEAPAIYKIAPTDKEKYLVQSIDFFAANKTSQSVMMTWNNFFGKTKLSDGLTFRIEYGGNVTFATKIRQIADLFSWAKTSQFNDTDSTDSYLKISVDFSEAPIVLNGNDGDQIKVILNDDLTNLLLFRISASVLIENRDQYINPQDLFTIDVDEQEESETPMELGESDPAENVEESAVRDLVPLTAAEKKAGITTTRSGSRSVLVHPNKLLATATSSGGGGGGPSDEGK